MELGWPLPKRQKCISDLPPSSDRTYQFEFQGELRAFHIHSIRLEMPKYRLENGRTQAAQDEYLARQSSDDDEFFSRDPESASAQRAQHEILEGMMMEEGLLDFFRSGNRQTEPVILDSKGFLVNGNRRVCAWRHLLGNDAGAYGHFTNIQAVILPSCTDEDIDDLEAKLQIQRDIRSDYSWINRAFMLRKKLGKYSDRELARRYGMQKKEVNTHVALIDFVDEYLEGRGKPHQYSSVAKEEHSFKRLYENRQKLDKESDRLLLDQLAYKLIGNPQSDLGRNYTAIPDIKKHLHKIKTSLERDLPAPQRESAPESTSLAQQLLGSATTERAWLLDAVKSPENTEAVTSVLTDVILEQRALAQSKKEATALLRYVQNANTALKSATNLKSSTASLDGVEEQLLEVEKSLTELKQWVTKSN